MFNPKQSAFWLIVAVIAVQLIVVLAGVSACIYAGLHLGMNTQGCDNGRFGEVLAGALAVGLALYGVSKE